MHVTYPGYYKNRNAPLIILTLPQNYLCGQSKLATDAQVALSKVGLAN
jgi:hypothetical protein